MSGPYRFDSPTRTRAEQTIREAAQDYIDVSQVSHVERAANFPLYTLRQDITRYLARQDLFMRVLGVHGSIVECGVGFGGGIAWWAHLSSIFEPFNHTRRVIGFDTFQGFPGVAPGEGAGTKEGRVGGLAVDSRQDIRAWMDLHDRNRPIGHIPKVELVEGDAVKTIPKYLDENQHLVVALLYLDFDIMAPTRVALDGFVPLMPRGAVIAWDEMGVKEWPGETRATLDWARERDGFSQLAVQRLNWSSTMSFAVIG